MSYVNKPVRKKDAMALVTGQPVYTDDLAPKDCLIVKVLRSPHAHAWIEEIKTDNAMKVPGIACVLTYEDVPGERFTMAGQTYPEFSPYDRLILDQRMRFVGDAAAIVAGETEKAVDRALKMIKVNTKCWSLSWIFMKQRTMQSVSIRRTTGSHVFLWGRTINGIYAPTRRRAPGMWSRSWQTATVWWSGHITQRPTSRQ